MPSKPFTPHHTSVYLDTSTISMVFRDDQGVAADYRAQLKAAIEMASREGNLCLSHAHLTEIARMHARTRVAVTGWLEDLDIVWIKAMPELVSFEFEVLAAAVLGNTDSGLSPYYSSFLNSLTFGVLESPTYIKPNILTFMIEGISMSEWFFKRADENFEQVWFPFSRDLIFDRLKARELGIDPDLEREVTDRKFLAFMEFELQRQIAGATSRTGTLAAQENHDFRKLVLQCAPFRFVMHRFNQGRKDRICEKHPRSNKFKKNERSTMVDAVHLVGAAYCDIHVCDKWNAKDMGSARAELGKANSLFWTQKNQDQFLEALCAPFVN